MLAVSLYTNFNKSYLLLSYIFFIVILIIYKKFSDFQKTLIFIWIFGFTYFTRLYAYRARIFLLVVFFILFEMENKYSKKRKKVVLTTSKYSTTLNLLESHLSGKSCR